MDKIILSNSDDFDMIPKKPSGRCNFQSVFINSLHAEYMGLV